MKVKNLITILNTLDQDAVIDMASDEEGNCFGDISQGIAEGILESTGEKVYTIYPQSIQDATDRYRY